ncbi:hypothetical protein V499_01405 [Pseudogymnoascus sp. VKM F-103]|nr:hypothetical protein V499_01405 [Pseudogymnoascus sp. VKM F-103]
MNDIDTTLTGDVRDSALSLDPQTSGQKPKTRSCQLCHQRKIRCDKTLPCSNCVRGHTSCHYPGNERKARRPHKTTITDVASRVTKLERVIAAMSNHHGIATEAAATTEGQAFHTHDGAGISRCSEVTIANHPETREKRESSTEELLVQDGESSCYVNEVLLSRERALQSTIGTLKEDITGPSNNVDLIDIGMPFSHFKKPALGDKIRLPSRRYAIQLWRTYIENVDPMGKILHIPTMEAALFGAANNAADVDSDLSALLFSIYFAATTSLESSVVARIYSDEKGCLLSRFKEGLEQCLAGSNFLAHPTMKSLQAMAIYLRSLRAYDLGRSSWTLFGLAMRSAQSVGLHRDGSNFKLPPFETEMRRRLWWFLWSIEAREAEDHGISVSDYMIDLSGTRFPSNLDDGDLYPGMTELPASKPTWTAMTFSLATWETSLLIYRTMSSSSSGSSHMLSREQLLRDHLTHLEDAYLKHCNPDIPVQRAAILMGRLLSAKASFITQQQELKRIFDPAQPASTATEESLITACQILEMNIQLQTEEILRDFQWVFVTYTQYHPLLYVLWHLYIKPTGPNVDRAWATVLQAFEIASRRESSAEGGSKWSMVQILKQKACRRTQESAEQQLTVAGSGRCVASSTPSALDDIQNPSLWDMDTMDISDWNNLTDNFNVYDFEG